MCVYKTRHVDIQIYIYICTIMHSYISIHTYDSINTYAHVTRAQTNRGLSSISTHHRKVRSLTTEEPRLQPADQGPLPLVPERDRPDNISADNLLVSPASLPSCMVFRLCWEKWRERQGRGARKLIRPSS